MLTTYLFAAAALLATGVVAQTPYTSTPTSSPSRTGSSGSPSESAEIIEIAVGADLHKFTPEEVTAEVGDIIRFNFYPGGHRVARSEWQRPCIPYEMTGPNKRGFYSGVFDPKTITLPFPHYDVRVNDTNPIFFYCGAPGSCWSYGMVGIINPSKDMPLEVFKQQALNQTFQLLPGDPWPSETEPATPTPTAPTGGGASPGTGDNAQQSSGSESGGSSLSTGAIAGIAIGGVAVLILGAALIYLCGRRGGFDKAYRKSAVPGAGSAGTGAGEGLTPAMIEAKYGPGPKSPGQSTVATFPGHHDPYRVSAPSPHGQHFMHNGTPPPPTSPGMSGYNSYGGTLVPGAQYPSTGDVQPQYAYQHANVSPQPLHSPQFQAPVELPSTENPTQVHSPPPQYGGDRDSWTAGQDPAFRPGKP